MFKLPAAQHTAPEVRGILYQRGSRALKTAPSTGWLVSHSPEVNAVPTLGQTLFQAPGYVQQTRQARSQLSGSTCSNHGEENRKK